MEDDLDALRHHHDLLSVLYWAAPTGHRPRIDLIRNLVDFSRSHREVCRLNIKAWMNLAKYQLSIDEPVEALQPFAAWFKDIIEQCIMQFRLARTEAEAAFSASKARGDGSISAALVESVVSKNQNQILATLSDAMSSMVSAISASKSGIAAAELVYRSGVCQVFSLLDGRRSKVTSILIEALNVYQALLSSLRRESVSSFRHSAAANRGKSRVWNMAGIRARAHARLAANVGHLNHGRFAWLSVKLLRI